MNGVTPSWSVTDFCFRRFNDFSYISPMRYFIDFGYAIILKGSNLAIVVWDVVGILLFGIALMNFSLWWFRRSLAGMSLASTLRHQAHAAFFIFGISQ